MPMTAKYATTCGVCATAVSPGDAIARSGQRWAHAACATTAGPAPAPSKAHGARRETTKKAPRPDMPAAEGALEVWTDGACSGNPGPGGWAWATRDGRQASDGEACLLYTSDAADE